MGKPLGWPWLMRSARRRLPQLCSWHCAQDEIELALALVVERAARLEERPRRPVDGDAHRQAARLMRDERGERQQRLRLVGERRGLLALGAALLDARLQVQEAAEPGVVERDSASRRL